MTPDLEARYEITDHANGYPVYLTLRKQHVRGYFTGVWGNFGRLIIGLDGLWIKAPGDYHWLTIARLVASNEPIKVEM